MTKPMRILFVHPVLSNQGGAQLSFNWLVNGLAGRGYKIVYAARTIALKLSNPGIRTIALPENQEIETIGRLAKDADIVITGNYPATHWVGLAKKASSSFPPVICNSTEPPRQLYEEALSPNFLRSRLDPKFYFPWSRALQKKRLRSAIALDQELICGFDRLLAIGNYAGSLFQKVYHRLAQVIPLGVGDMEPKPPHFPDGPFIFLAPAGLEPIKNFETTIDAFAMIARENDVRLILTGDGIWRKKAEKMAARFGIKETISFAGWISRDRLKAFYRECHAVIYVPIDEPFGLVACEAGLYGKASIVTNHGGPAEIIENRITGLHANPFDRDELAKKMLELYQNRNLGILLGQRAQKRIAASFNYQNYLSEFEAICRIIL